MAPSKTGCSGWIAIASAGFLGGPEAEGQRR